MNAGSDKTQAMAHAKDNANGDSKTRYVHFYGGVYWVETTPCQGCEAVYPDWTRARIDAVCAQHGVKVDAVRAGAGNFRDLEIGVGAPWETLHALMGALKDCGCRIHIGQVDNKQHPDYGKSYLFVHSFWSE